MWVYALASVALVSLLSFAGILTLVLREKRLKKVLLYLVSFSVGGLLGVAFLHLLPEVVEEAGFGLNVSAYVLLGIVISFLVEKLIYWRHCHIPTSKEHPHTFAFMNLFGDAVHNFIDGLIIGASYLANIPLGLAVTLAVIFHEIPQEIGDFGVLLYGGFSKNRALILNFLTALTAILGVAVAIFLSSYVENLTSFLIPFAAGSFIYIAGTDLIPELKKEVEPKKSMIQLVALILGIVVMLLLVYLG